MKIIEHFSSGGFVFYKEVNTAKLFVVLVKNRRGEFVLPKGHIERNEDTISAAIREIHEEAGVNKAELVYVGFLKTEKYTFIQEEVEHSKKVDLHIFQTKNKADLAPLMPDEIKGAEWVEFYDAIKLLNFNQTDLLAARQMFYYLQRASGESKIPHIRSIVIAVPTFNGELTIGNTLNCVLDQIRALPSEIKATIIVCLDHCLDQTRSIVTELRNDNLIIYENLYDQGKGNALNFIFENSSSDLFIVVDDDVLPSPGSISNLIRAFSEQNDLRIGYLPWKRIPYLGKTFTKKFWDKVFGVKFEIQPYDQPSQILKGACMALRSDDYVSFPNEPLINEDQFLQYIYWPDVREIKGSWVEFYSVLSPSDYYNRFRRISFGSIIAKKYFDGERVKLCDNNLYREIDWKKISKLPISQKAYFYLYRIIRTFVSLKTKKAIQQKKMPVWKRIKKSLI